MFGSSMQQHAGACQQKHAAGVVAIVAIAAAGTLHSSVDRTRRVADVGCSMQEAAASSWHAGSGSSRHPPSQHA
jgi:hypothetical protein